MTFIGFPFRPSEITAETQSRHLVRRSAIELSDLAASGEDVKLDRLINERQCMLSDGRRISLRFLAQAADKTRRPSRSQIKVFTDAANGIPAKLVLTRSVGAGVQGDLWYKITNPKVIASFKTPGLSTLWALSDLYLTLGLGLVGFGLADISGSPGKDADAIRQFRLLSAARRDAQSAHMGIWASVPPGAKVLRKLITP